MYTGIKSKASKSDIAERMRGLGFNIQNMQTSEMSKLYTKYEKGYAVNTVTLDNTRVKIQSLPKSVISKEDIDTLILYKYCMQGKYKTIFDKCRKITSDKNISQNITVDYVKSMLSEGAYRDILHTIACNEVSTTLDGIVLDDGTIEADGEIISPIVSFDNSYIEKYYDTGRKYVLYCDDAIGHENYAICKNINDMEFLETQS